MAGDFDDAFLGLCAIFTDVLPKLQVTADSDKEYTLSTQVASPLPQHKGAPMFFASVRKGKAYASLHLFPLYTNPELKDGMSPELTKRQQGLTCFNFKAAPDAKQAAELRKLAKASLKAFKQKEWA